MAISNERKTAKFYTISENANPNLKNEVGGPWGDLVGSLNRDHLFTCKPNLSNEHVQTIEIECVLLQDIVDKYDLKRVDVIQMDTEGHDDMILLSMDFEKIKPNIIIFEHNHMTFEKYQACMEYLQTHGYSVIHTSQLDTVVGLEV